MNPGSGPEPEGVQAFGREAIIGENGKVVLAGLPIAPGQAVEVLITVKQSGTEANSSLGLWGSVLAYDAPLDPAATEDWDALH